MEGNSDRNLKFSQLTLVSGTDREPEKLVYVSFGEKNNLGGLKHRNLRQKRIKHYANDEEPAMWLVRLYKKYLEKCPKTASRETMYSTSLHDRNTSLRMKAWYLTIRLLALVFFEQIVNEAQPSWLSLVENEGE